MKHHLPRSRSLVRPVFAALPLVLLSSCLLSQRRVNEPIRMRAVDELVVGIDASEVTARLGAPVEVVELGERSAWRYEFERTKQTGLFLFVFNMVNQDTRSDRVWCFFDADHRLTHVGTTLEASEVSYGLR